MTTAERRRTLPRIRGKNCRSYLILFLLLSFLLLLLSLSLSLLLLLLLLLLFGGAFWWRLPPYILHCCTPANENYVVYIDLRPSLLQKIQSSLKITFSVFVEDNWRSVPEGIFGCMTLPFDMVTGRFPAHCCFFWVFFLFFFFFFYSDTLLFADSYTPLLLLLLLLLLMLMLLLLLMMVIMLFIVVYSDTVVVVWHWQWWWTNETTSRNILFVLFLGENKTLMSFLMFSIMIYVLDCMSVFCVSITIVFYCVRPLELKY